MTSDPRDKLLLDLAERLGKARAAMPGLDQASPSYNDDFWELAVEAGSAEDAIMSMPAFTPSGMAVKVVIVLWHVRDELAGTPDQHCDEYPLTAAVLSLGRDIERLASHA